MIFTCIYVYLYGCQSKPWCMDQARARHLIHTPIHTLWITRLGSDPYPSDMIRLKMDWRKPTSVLLILTDHLPCCAWCSYAVACTYTHAYTYVYIYTSCIIRIFVIVIIVIIWATAVITTVSSTFGMYFSFVAAINTVFLWLLLSTLLS